MITVITERTGVRIVGILLCEIHENSLEDSFHRSFIDKTPAVGFSSERRNG